MTYRITSGVICIILVASGCSSLKQSAAGTTKSTASARPAVVNKNPKFLDNISVTPESSTTNINEANKTNRKTSREQNYFPYSSDIEKATPLQFKYALLLNTEVEEIRNARLYKFIDDWYGTRYCMGGTTKTCIDCSAFVQLFFSSIYGVVIPRTAKDQYDAADKISTTKLQQGDLLFFNTRGGVSHVGVYLQNNKFVHASTTGGVMISDMFEAYYVKHFIGAGHIDNRIETAGKK
jgi:cell wall-associated NlpC family hydrolase